MKPMNKLNEIEVRAAVIALPAHPLSGKIQSDFDLLIRAVRQLGGAVLEVREEHRDSKDRNYNECDHEQCGWCELLDPDVLTLLEDADA